MEKPGNTGWCRNKDFIAIFGLGLKSIAKGNALLFERSRIRFLPLNITTRISYMPLILQHDECGKAY